MPGEREIAQALLSSYEPSLRDRAGNAIYDIARALGMGSTANRMRNEGTAVLDFIPGVGDVVGFDDAKRDFDAGNYGMAAAGLGLTAAGAVPGVGDAVSNAGRKGIRAFHSSRADFDRFQPSPHRGASFFASTPDRARLGGGAGQREMVMETASAYDKDTRPLRTYEVNIDPEHIAGLNYTPAERDWFDSLPSEVIGDDALEDVLKNKPMNIQNWDDVYEPVQVGERLFKYIKKPQPPSISYEEAYRRGRDIYGRQHAHWGPQSDEVLTAERVNASGMKGYLINDEAGLSIAVIDPAIIEIVKKYGLAGAVAAGLISQEMAAQMQAQGMGEI